MSRQSSDTPHYAVCSPTSTLKHGKSNRYLLENLCGYDDGFDRTIGGHTVWWRKKPSDPGK